MLCIRLIVNVDCGIDGGKTSADGHCGLVRLPNKAPVLGPRLFLEILMVFIEPQPQLLTSALDHSAVSCSSAVRTILVDL